MAGDTLAETESEAPARLYQNFLVDTTRWSQLPLRAGDIVLSTPPKAGTTWTQTILAHLLFGAEWPAELHDLSPWLELRLAPVEAVTQQLEDQTHRRFIKSHIARDGLPFAPEVFYVIVARDPRDVFMSFVNFRRNWSDEMVELMNATPGRVGDPVPPFEEDLHVYWKTWLSRGWFEGERDGFPMMSTFHHLQSWWEVRDRPNVLLMHYGDMLQDLPGEIARLASFLSVELSPERVNEIAEATEFAAMKKDAARYTYGGGALLKGGADSFFYKGTNERWRGVFSDEELALYEAAAAERFRGGCARWVEGGRHAVDMA